MRPSGDPSRPRSCPPIVEANLVDDWYSPEEGEVLHVGPEVLSGYSNVKCVFELPSTCLYRVDGHLCLKLIPALYDIDAVVRTMRLASHVVPVPRVHRYGRSGNCCFMVMDWIAQDGIWDLRHLTGSVPLWAATARLETSLRPIVDGLHRLGISHNDMYPRNMFVDRYWRVCAVIDWDMANYARDGEEYRQRLLTDYRSMSPEWNYMFLAPCRPFGCGLVVCSGDVTLEPLGYHHSRPLFHDMIHFGVTDVPHGLDPKATNLDVPRPEPTVIILAGGDGRGALCYLDDCAKSVNGVTVARIFTQESPLSALQQRGIYITSLAEAPCALDRLPEDELARLAIRELPSFVFLVDWTEPLSISFLNGLCVTLDLWQPDGPGATIVRFETEIVAPDGSAPSERKLRHQSTLLSCGPDGKGGLSERSQTCLEFYSFPLDVDDQAARERAVASMERDAAVAVVKHFLHHYMPTHPKPVPAEDSV